MKNFLKKNMKRAMLGIGTIGLVVVSAASFSAFEAHVINVTARIENALAVSEAPIDFGTVFPQEYLTSDILVSLSDSFVAEDRVDDVEYVIKQKPKVKALCPVEQAQVPCDPMTNPTPGDPYETITVGETFTGPAWQYCEENLPPDFDTDDTIGYTVDLSNPYWLRCYLPLANSLSKHELTTDGNDIENDDSVDAFHQAYVWDSETGKSSLDPAWYAFGRLAKSVNDTSDTWQIDLKVPCFHHACAQEAFDPLNLVNDPTPGFHIPTQFMLDPKTEHMVFGTDLWIEVTEISLPPIAQCTEPLDLALVLDRSSSISPADLVTLKTAAAAFVNALGMSSTGPHGAQVSFSTNATLDVPLTDNTATLIAAINALATGGTTNLEEALLIATAELETEGVNPGDDRDDNTSPDFIVLITDGAPTASIGDNDHATDAMNAATAAKNAGIRIFVVGVGTDAGTTTFLQGIASPGDYFDSADFASLQTILQNLTLCPPTEAN